MPYDGRAYLSDRQRNAINAVASRSPSAIVVTFDIPAGRPYLYNVSQDEVPWPVPVLVVGTVHAPLLAAARAARAPLRLRLDSAYRRDVEGMNVVARRDRGSNQTIVISMPTTG